MDKPGMASFGTSSREWLAAACIVRERVQTKVEVQRRAAADVAKVNRRKVSVLRPARFRRFKAADVRAILLAGSGLPTPGY